MRVTSNRHGIVIGLSQPQARIATHLGDFLVTLEYAMLVLFLPASAGIFFTRQKLMWGFMPQPRIALVVAARFIALI
ncbi:hypothetical protein HA50_04330 [Pantoea cypripedii]|uniref:Uncharacterized protein n=1 Tax=Pantoea cypripedii TaxID=55209 RepID=A0A1X1ERY5_PANCY|nr:hypothetical protein HA50_04330 [Pantoea cypripedii]